MEPHTRREVIADFTAALLFVVLAGALWMIGGMPAPGLTGVWLALLYMLLVRVEFRVGAGRSAPVILALVPMFLLIPAPVIPLLAGVSHTLARMPLGLARGERNARLALPLLDAWYTIAPALLVAVLPAPVTLAGDAALVAAACVLLFASDLVAWTTILWVGTGVFPHEEVRVARWLYAFDVMLMPIGFALALATREVALAPAAIVPLAVLLAFFARERRAREEHAATLQTILQHASDVILITGRDGRLRRVLGAAAELFGADDDGRGSLLDRVHPDDVTKVTRFLASAPGEAEFRLRVGNRHVHAVAADLTGDPQVRALVLTVRDDEARQALRRRATHDPLTGLANRALLLERIAASTGEVTLLYLDLDGFKPINDRLGHAAGDEVLRIVARRLEHCVRAEQDTVARLGGDEFAVLVGDRAEDVTARVRTAFRDPFIVAGEPLRVGASLGLATGPPDAESLLAAADRAMYAVKRDTARPARR
jgi:diguanylate cyclase (GGDEF)-like protein